MHLFRRKARESEEVTPGRRLGWMWRLMPVLVLAVLIPFGWLLYTTVEDGLRTQVESQLESVLRADVAALRIWMDDKKTTAGLIAAQEPVKVPAMTLVEQGAAPDASPASLRGSPSQRQLSNAMQPLLTAAGATGYAVFDDTGRIVAADRPELIGEQVPPETVFVAQVAGGETVISHPFESIVPLPDEDGGDPRRQPTMFVATPLTDTQGAVVGGLGLRLQPEEFTEILTVARWGESGETYAFDSQGRLLSRSRFEGQLKESGLLPDRNDVTSILNVRVVDPGYNVLDESPPRNLSPDRPLTRMAASAVTGSDGVDAEGYRDYRGVPVVGAWTWLGDSDLGVTTEVDVAEAFSSLGVVRWIFFILYGLVALAAILVLYFSRSLYFLRVHQRKGEKAADRLGQYSLEEKIGEGGLGEVYKASHVLLRRPTAVKLLHPDRVSDEEVTRFEREVRLASRLTSPHTIRIYDYGISPTGVFYYAMEYLPGADLERLVDRTGPAPEGRVIHFLLQACDSLQEAHGKGIVHRDIKPGNLIVSQHGCELDFVVLTDFGLAKDLWGKELTNITNPRFAVGTPRFLPPEALRRESEVDELGDIYSLGATAYYLLTGHEPLDADSVLEIVQKVLLEEPEPPSVRLRRPLSADLETVVMQCLEKDPRDRPASVEALHSALRTCTAYGTWSEDDARVWWAAYGEEVAAPAEPPADRPALARAVPYGQPDVRPGPRLTGLRRPSTTSAARHGERAGVVWPAGPSRTAWAFAVPGRGRAPPPGAPALDLPSSRVLRRRVGDGHSLGMSVLLREK